MDVIINMQTPQPRKLSSRMITQINNGEFVFTGELEPGRTTTIDPLIDEANKISKYIVAANITDNPGSFVAMNGLAAAIQVKFQTNIEPIFQLTCRDQNRIGLAGSLLGALAAGIKNILVLTGDHTSLGDIPQSKPVFDLDSAQLLHLAKEIKDQHHIYGIPLDDTENIPNFHIGIGANPNSSHPEIELLKIKRKIELGAEFIQTQVVFDLEKCTSFLQELQKLNVPVLVGLFPMKNYSTARDFDKFIPGVSIPKDLLQAFKAVKNGNSSKQEKHIQYDKINTDFLNPMIKELKSKGYAKGIHVTAVHYSRIFPKFGI